MSDTGAGTLDQGDLRDGDHESSDAELITAVRSGDNNAYGALFERHRIAALRLARQLLPGAEAEDLVSEAFTKVFVLLQNGKGPDLAFRAYLLTAIRRLHVDRIRAGQRLRTTDDESELDRHVEFFDLASINFERGTAADAFASLPERWQLVLWHLDVEGQKPAEVAPLLGMSANSVSALAYRAREGLRQAYLQHHLADTAAGDCRWTTERMGAHVRKGLSTREAVKVDEHLDGCRRCMGIYLELTEVNSNLSGILAPAILGTAAAGYLAGGAAGAGAAAGAAVGLKGLLAKLLIEPVKGLVASQPAAAAAVAVAAVATTAVIAVAATHGPTHKTVAKSPAVVAPATPGPTTRGPSTPSPSPSAPVTVPAPTTAAALIPAPQTPDPSPAPTPNTPTTPPPTTPTPPPIVPADLGIGPIIVSPGQIPLLGHKVTIPLTRTGTAPAEPVGLTITIDFRGIVVFSRVIGNDWQCTEAAFSHVAACTRTQSGPDIPPLVFGAIALRFAGTATISSTADDDPSPGNNSARFSFGLLSHP